VVLQNVMETPHLADQKSHAAYLIYMVIRRRILYHDGGACLEGLIDSLQW
jgi:hypothetical protein